MSAPSKIYAGTRTEGMGISSIWNTWKTLVENPVEYLNKESLIERLELKLESYQNSYRLVPDDFHLGQLETCKEILEEIKTM